MTVVIITPQNRSPWQLYLLALITISGIAFLTDLSKNPITDAMGQPYTHIWGFFLAIGGFLCLLGIHWPKKSKNPVTGMLIERTGLVALGGASLIWSVLVIWRVHMSGLFSATLTFGLFLASIAQWFWINSNVNRVIKAINDK